MSPVLARTPAVITAVSLGRIGSSTSPYARANTSRYDHHAPETWFARALTGSPRYVEPTANAKVPDQLRPR
jgi:hypothetical protein